MHGNVNLSCLVHLERIRTRPIRNVLPSFDNRLTSKNASKQHLANYRHETYVIALSLAEDL